MAMFNNISSIKKDEKILKNTSLSSLEISVIESVIPCLPFIENLTKGKISIYAPDKCHKNYFCVYGDDEKNIIASPVKSALIFDSFRTGKSFNQWEESESGGNGIRSFCIKEGLKTIAVVTLSYRLTLPMSEFTHILHGVELLISYGRRFDSAVWQNISAEAGVMIADGYGRITFADDVARHIYRFLGALNVIGRNIKDADLKQAVAKETYSKKSPWEREMTTKNKILRERLLSFAQGGENKGYIIILEDITRENKAAEDEKIQAALKKRIAELEDELTDIKDSLAARKLVEKAKGVLMKNNNLTEEESYSFLRREAMMNRMTIKEVAQNILGGKK